MSSRAWKKPIGEDDQEEEGNKQKKVKKKKRINMTEGKNESIQIKNKRDKLSLIYCVARESKKKRSQEA